MPDINILDAITVANVAPDSREMAGADNPHELQSFAYRRQGRPAMSTAPASGGFANIGKTILIKGEISGQEDVYVDGQIEGSVQLLGNSLTIGPNGKVHASVAAKNVTVGGSLEGNIQASERTEMRKSAVVNGDVQTRRIAIEEGAFFKGKLEILTETKPTASNVAAAAASTTTPPSTPPEPGK